MLDRDTIEPRPMPIDLICLDADDTLWHNMRHFDVAERALFALLAPFAEAGISRARLDAVEARNLHLYGYGAKGFTLSMIEAAIDLGGPDLPAATIAEILRVGRDLLAHKVVQLRVGRDLARLPLALAHDVHRCRGEW